MQVLEKEKINSLIQNYNRSLKSSQLADSFSKNTSKKNVAKFKNEFEGDNLKKINDENNHENLLFFKSPRVRKYRQTERYHLVSRNVDLSATFAELVKQWREETRGVSSTNQMSMHPAYQQIIGMGEEAIPLLLRELERKSGHWFWALKSITREDPVPPEHRGKVNKMIKAWLDWGKNRGYRW